MDLLIHPLLAAASTCIALVVAVLFARLRSGLPRPLGFLLDCFCLLPLVTPDLFELSHVRLVSLPVYNVYFSWFMIVSTMSAISFPVLYIAARCAFTGISGDTLDAAQTLGMGQWRMLCRVMIPIGLPWLAGGFLTGVLLTLIQSPGPNRSVCMEGVIAAVFALVLLRQLPKRLERVQNASA